MKKSVLIVLVSFSFVAGYAQNKTLGVGTAAPNPNAALHVESPTNNQGFIMPRLSTVNRTSPGFQGVLTASDVGLMVYDTDLKAIYIWDGTAWGSAAKLALPYQDSVLTAPANSNLLKLYYGGTAAGNVGVAYFENLNPNNAFAPLFARTNGTGSASNFFINNSANTGSAVNGTTNGSGSGIRGLNTGTGNAGNFTINNAANTVAALRTTTNGSGAAINASNTGVTDGFAGLYSNTQASNTFPAIQASTAGTGTGVRVIQNATSIGGGMDVIMQNTSGTAPGLFVNQQGLGNAGSFLINNSSSTNAAVYGSNNGTGDGAYFEVNNATTFGAALKGRATNTGGSGGAFEIFNATNSNAALYTTTQGTGNAASFNITNAGSGAPAVSINHSGTGNAITANRPIQASQFIGDGSGLTNLPSVSFPFSTSLSNASTLFDITNTGAGKAGNFSINNTSNADNTLRVTTNGLGDNGWFEVTNATGTGSAIVAASNSQGATVFSTNSNGTTGAAGYFGNTNPAGTASALTGATNSNAGGAVAPVGVYGVSTGTGSLGGAFRVNNTANSYPALYAETNGTGSTIFAKQISATSGNAGYFEVSNVANPASGLYAKTYGTGTALSGLTTGTGTAGRFEISNSGNTNTALEALTDGTGAAISAMNNGTGFGMYARAIGATDAIYAEKQAADGTGSAGNFWNHNASNGASTLFAATNAAAGSALGLINSADGNALSLFQGGMKLSTAPAPLTGGGDITTRAFAYLISDATSAYTFPAGFLGNGDIFYFYNEDGSNNATIDGTIVIQPNSGALVIYLGGALRAVYGGVAP